jgi:2,4-dienoyl-CoA reductase-like NADH-dependent reductase (Old Yellow Enzyme family)
LTASLSDTVQLSRGQKMSNRFALAPLTNLQSNPDGTLSDDEFDFLVRRADGGFGMVMTCAAHVQQSGQGFPGQLGTFSDAHLPGLERLASAINARGSVSAVQLQHSGERSVRELTGMDIVAPFANPEKGARALSTGEVEQLIADFVAAAVRCEKAGFHGVELHGAHGYLLCLFLDARNQRSDRFGGSWENRTRICHEVINGIRSATGPDFQLGLRLSPEKYGYGLADVRDFAQKLMTTGQLDWLDMSLWDSFKLPDEADYQSRPLIDWFTDLDRGTCRLGVAGKIFSTQNAQDCLDHGADFVFIGRGAILHHDFPERAVANSDFVSKRFPVTRDYLAQESVGPAFIDYLATQWRNYVV